MSRRTLGAAAGLLADRFLGEPPVPDGLHPVAAFGSLALALERRLHANARLPGAVYTALGAGLAWSAGHLVRSPAVACYVTTSGRALHTAAGEVLRALDRGDLEAARASLPNLVGRDPAELEEKGIARAVVESVAENTTDAIVAPALWTAVGGAPAAFLHRAGDTLDSMVGYRDERYGRFGATAARLDDALAWAPARVTAALVAAARPRRAPGILDIVRSDASNHPSPNAGVAEAAFAAALDLRLGGPNQYGERLEARPSLGRGRTPVPEDIRAAVALSRDVTWALASLLLAVGLVSGRPHLNGGAGAASSR